MKMESKWFKDYFKLYDGLSLNDEIINQLIDLKKQIQEKAKENSIFIFGNGGSAAISSSGKSENMVNAANYARKNQISVVTFTGFDINNPLKAIGDINFWVDSKAYNIVEMIHQIWLLSVCDSIIGKAEYSAS